MQRGTLVIEQWLPNSVPKPIYPDALATLSIDSVDSKGRPGIPVTAKLRPIVRRVDGSSWYSFVMTDAAQTIEVGDTATVAIAFVNPEDARIDFPEGTRTVFGDGPAIFGSFVLERWLDAG